MRTLDGVVDKKFQTQIDKSFGIGEGFETGKQEMIMSCGPQNILDILKFLSKRYETATIPNIEELQKEANITEKKGITPNQYESLLNKYLKPLGYFTRQVQNPTYEEIIEHIEQGLPVSTFMLVQSNRNPNRSEEAAASIPEDQHGYHFETTIGYNYSKKKKLGYHFETILGTNGIQDKSKDSNKEPHPDLIRLSNPFGYQEILTKDEFETRRGLDKKLLQSHRSVVDKTINKLLKTFGIVKPRTVYFIEPLSNTTKTENPTSQ